MKFLIPYCTIILLLLPGIISAQTEAYDAIKDNEMSIPSSPAFAMLGVNPEMVLRPSDIKSFKVDWRIKNYNLAPDLALEGQPIWYLHYRKKSFKEYARVSPFEKKLSTLALSLATAKLDGLNHAAFALKTNIYAEKDPVVDSELLKRMQREYASEIGPIEAEMDSIRNARDLEKDRDKKKEMTATLESLQIQKDIAGKALNVEYKTILDNYYAENWNRTMLDAAMGWVYTYNNTGFDSLKVKRAGWSFWLNGCKKVGKNGLLTGIYKYTHIVDASNHLLGVSYRHGSPKFNFFVEFAYERQGNYFDDTMENQFSEDEFFIDSYSEDLGSGWYNFNNIASRNLYTVAYGGDFKISRNILLNFAIRTQYTNKIKLDRLLPVANLVCLMN